MKKWKIISVMAAVTIMVSLFAIPTSAEKIKVLYNGEELSFDVSPKIQDNRVLVPMRTIFEAFGAKVKWDGESRKVTTKKNSDTIEMTVDSNEMKKNEETIVSDVSPVIEDGRTLIPLRAVNELLDLEVEWDEKNKTAEISETEKDDSWKENKGEVNLTAFSVTGEGNSAADGVITITEAGDYAVTGECGDGQIVIDSEGKVKLRLSGMSLTNKNGAAIYVKNADKAFITLAEDTENYLSDGESYENEEEKAVITAKDNLEIKGNGKLTINAEYNHGIHASDSLSIENGNITIRAKNDAIHVNDTCKVSGGTLDLTVYGDGIQAEEIVEISGGTINITTKGDVPAATNEKHFGAAKEETEETEENNISSKGIKADWLMEISGGKVNITSTDHAIHCASDITIDGGDITINSDNKGISAHGNLTINGGSFNIPKASEGIESKQIMTINDGEFYIIASDDGLNAGGGAGFGGFGGGMQFGRNFDNAENGEMPQTPEGENMHRGMRNRDSGNTEEQKMGERPDFKNDNMPKDAENGMPDFKNGNRPEKQDSDMSGAPDFDRGARDRGNRGGNGMEMPPQMSENGNMPPEFAGGQNGNMPPEFAGGNGSQKGGMGALIGNSDEESSEHHIQINGGSFYICAVNDGIDANGSITITGGTVVVEGRSVAAGGELGLDADAKVTISGGEVLAAGSTVYQNGAEQNTAVISLSKTAEAGAHFEIKDEKGNTVAEIKSVRKAFSQILYSSKNLKAGKSYSVYIDDTLCDTFTQEEGLTTVGEAQNMGFGGGLKQQRQ